MSKLTSLKDRLAKLKESSNDSLTVESPFPFSSFLDLYIRGGQSINYPYMMGTRLLINWLRPIQLPRAEIPESHKRAIDLLRSYETHELAKHLVGTISTLADIDRVNRIEAHIIMHLINHSHKVLNND